MEKSILIIGTQGSGKTTKAREIANQFKEDEVKWLFYNEKVNSFLQKLSEKTRLIIFEGVYDISGLKQLVKKLEEPLKINGKESSQFTISPMYILTCQQEILEEQLVELGTIFYERFEIIKC
jgi:adenylate kinase family enzyme